MAATPFTLDSACCNWSGRRAAAGSTLPGRLRPQTAGPVLLPHAGRARDELLAHPFCCAALPSPALTMAPADSPATNPAWPSPQAWPSPASGCSSSVSLSVVIGRRLGQADSPAWCVGQRRLFSASSPPPLESEGQQILRLGRCFPISSRVARPKGLGTLFSPGEMGPAISIPEAGEEDAIAVLRRLGEP